jgi:hypothetical protein
VQRNGITSKIPISGGDRINSRLCGFSLFPEDLNKFSELVGIHLLLLHW